MHATPFDGLMFRGHEPDSDVLTVPIIYPHQPVWGPLLKYQLTVANPDFAKLSRAYSSSWSSMSEIPGFNSSAALSNLIVISTGLSLYCLASVAA
jgi:hypothetical protein